MEHRELDRQDFERAVEQYSDSMFRVAFRLSGNRQQAEEIVQEAFMGAWKNFSQLREPGKLRAWLFGVLRNQFYKSTVKETRHSANPLVEEPIATEPRSTDLQESVQAALARLPEEQRMPLLLVTMEGWSVSEAAELLGIPQGTVLSRMQRGREKLKQFLTPELEWIKEKT